MFFDGVTGIRTCFRGAYSAWNAPFFDSIVILPVPLHFEQISDRSLSTSESEEKQEQNWSVDEGVLSAIIVDEMSTDVLQWNALRIVCGRTWGFCGGRTGI
jgi:hypothetical protein